MERKLILLLTWLFVSMGLAHAQSQKITGSVISADDGQPVMGATVLVVGTNMGTTTNLDGQFVLSNVPKTAKKLRVSYVGMKTQEVVIKPNTKVVLEPDAEVLQEVVVTGMQKMDKRLFTGAATKISAENAKLDGMPEISRALEGRAAGVSVQNVSGTFGTAPKIRVRGATSIYGNSKPLWVVDGVILEDVTEVSADDLSSGDAVTLVSSAIAGLNADDIESFQILKDGSATSIYGARAMAGVIVVTTKKGKSGSNKISYTGEFSMRLKPTYREFNLMNSQEQMGVYKEMEAAGYLNLAETYRAKNGGEYSRMYHLIDQYNPVTGYGLENTTASKNKFLQQAEFRNTDWFDLLFNNNVSMNHAISMSSGTEKASYYTSLSVMNDPGWTKQSKVERYTANINALYHINKKFNVNLIANAAYRKQRAPGTINGDIDAVSGTVKRDFDINPYSYALNTSRTLDPNVFYIRSLAPFNIVNELENNYIDLGVTDLKFQAEFKYKPIPKVELSVLGAYKLSTTTQTHFITERSNQVMAYNMMDDTTMRDANPWLYTDPDNPNSLPLSVLPSGGFHNVTKYEMRSYDFRATASYNDVYNQNHIFNLFGGMEANALDRNSTAFDGVGMQYGMGMLPAFDYHYFKQLSEENGNYYSVGDTRGRDVAFFGTTTYSYKGKYTVNGTVRYEGSNKLGKSRQARWLPTWNVSGAWNAHEESWFEKMSSVLSNFTLKASYSLTADRGPAWVTNSRPVIKAYNPYRPFTDVKESGLALSDLENSELTYEKKHELNIGADIGFLKNRINLSVDWYKRNNYDLIGRIATSGGGGQVEKYANVASMKSHGVELALSTRNIVSKDFKWETSFIFSKTKNEVTDFKASTRVIDMITGTGFTMEGYPVRSLFSMDFKGLNERGLPTFVNESGQVTTSDINFQERIVKDHLIYEGPTDPTTTGSLGNVFSYKNFKLNVFMTYAFGNVVRLNPVFSRYYSDLDAMPREFMNRWAKPGDEKLTNIPVIAIDRQNQQDSKLGNCYNAYNYSTIRTAKGDFIRMKEISLAYDMPASWLKGFWVNTMALKFQATNLFLIYSDKDLNGQDPEFVNMGGVATPMARQFTLTVRLGL
ncbi:MAG: SusC/RagA family TonB-linked outer membrane protein [Bacteroidia bacterium]|nr:SusC/RagA family TonB-linked outer membrane protein [Bacteroidia bacterium]